MTHELASGQVLELEIEKLTCGGRGLGRLDGRAVFVERGLPSQRVRAMARKVAKRHAEAAVLEVLRPAPGQIEPFCPHYTECGGCNWQDLDYAEQLRWKRVIVAESLRHIGRYAGPGKPGGTGTLVEEVAPSPLLRGFRNKMEFAFAGQGQNLHVGLRAWRDPARVLDVTGCGLMAEPAMAVLAATRELARDGNAGAYDPATDQGVWRFLVLRRAGPVWSSEGFAHEPGRASPSPDPTHQGPRALGTRFHLQNTVEPEHECGQDATGMQAILITGPGAEASRQVEVVAKGLLARFPGMAVLHGVRQARTAVAQAEGIAATWGSPSLEMSVGPLRYRLSPQAFFQTNTAGAETLFSLVEELADLSQWAGGAEIFDCYCGAGAMALRLARGARRVTGFEVVEQAARDAAANARLNNLDNCAFVAGDLRRSLARRNLPRPHVVVVDPPRAGMHPEVAARLLALAPERIVSVSCDPATFARDLALLLPDYELARVKPVDLFPHSHHVESVALLTRKGSRQD